MRFRSKIALLGLATLAGFIVSRPDLRNEIAQMMEDYKLRFLEAFDKGMLEAGQKQQELEQELKASEEIK